MQVMHKVLAALWKQKIYIYIFEKHFRDNKQGEKLGVFFHLASPKTALLMRNLPLDPCKLGILPNTWGHYFQFTIKSRGDLHSPLSSNRRKTNFVNEPMEVWRTLSIYSLLIYIYIYIYIYIFSVFKALLVLYS